MSDHDLAPADDVDALALAAAVLGHARLAELAPEEIDDAVRARIAEAVVEQHNAERDEAS